ncbi:MAG TPA: type II secretion system F family protein [Candidatus Omnitrophota bacterium]|nr:type II secretion system F family protein [Candidatus Omnitrophota bacterium]
MGTYIYKAKKGATETVTGRITARSEDEAVDLIHQLGFLPISVTLQSVSQESLHPQELKKIKKKDLYFFNRQLANLLKSGVSIVKALTIIEEQTAHLVLKKVVSGLNDSLTNGRSLSESLSLYPIVFSPLYIAMVTAGEEGSRLQDVLQNIADYQMKEQQIRSKVSTALAYPLFMGFMGLLSVYFIMVFVLPKMSGLFESLGSSLPVLTIGLMQISRLLSQKGWIILLVVLGIISFWMRWMRTSYGRLCVSRLILSLPFLGDLLLKVELSRFCRTLVLLLKGGVSIVNALKIIIPMISNESIKAKLSNCRESLLMGGSLGEEIKKIKEIPSLMGHLIAVGEESGNIENVLEEIANTYEQETDEKIKVMTSLLEPAMILAVGLAIGVVVFAILLPIFQIDILAG